MMASHLHSPYLFVSIPLKSFPSTNRISRSKYGQISNPISNPLPWSLASVSRSQRSRTHKPFLFPQACASPEHNEEEDQSTVHTVRNVPLIALPMTAGNDFLFPGCHQVLKLEEEMAQRVLKDIADSDPPEFAYLILSAWGDPEAVGTIAIIEDFKYSPNNDSVLVCSGVARFHILQINDDLTQAELKIFQDEPPSDEEADKVAKLEKKLVTAMKDIVTISIKISDDKDQSRQRALEETLKRVEAFSENTDGPDVNHWIVNLSPNLRRELLSFIVLDMLSVSFMDRRNILESTNSEERLDAGLQGLEPFLQELAAKGAIIGALGRQEDEDTPKPSDPPA